MSLMIIKSPTKASANTLMMKLLTMRYDGHSAIRDYVMQLINITNQLKSMDMNISEGFLGNLFSTQEERLNQNKLEVAHLTETSSGRKGTFISSENKGYGTHKQNDRKVKKKCFFCKNNGHLKRNCFKYKNLDLSQHIEIKYLVLREKVRVLVVSIEHINTKLMIVVTLTRGLSPK
ncbi:hypothetical protein AMTRI_Chr13g82970 [Amborella trichopoda]